MKKFIFEDEAEDIDLLAEDDLDLVEDEENEEAEQINEVRYIDPENLDKYDKDEIEEVTTSSGEKRYRRKKAGQAPAKTQTNDFGGMTEKELDEWLEDNIDYSADSEHNAKQIAKQIPELKDKTKELADALDKAMDDDTIEKPFTYAIQKTLTANAPAEKRRAN